MSTSLVMCNREGSLNILSKLAPKLLGYRFLPCFVLSQEPLILSSCWGDFVAQYSAIRKVLPSRKRVYFLFVFDEYKESADEMCGVQERSNEILQSNSNFVFHFLCNSSRELELAKKCKLSAIHCHQNAFIDESLYQVNQMPKVFDAVYHASIDLSNCHALAKSINSLKLIGNYEAEDKSYFKQIMRLLKGAVHIHRVRRRTLSRHLSEAHVGLCLANNRKCHSLHVEYLLCGLPVVVSSAVKGVDALLDDTYTQVADETAESVAQSVNDMKRCDVDPLQIRQQTIERMMAHRQVLIDKLQDIFDDEGTERLGLDDFKKLFVHKLGVRVSNPPLHFFGRILHEKMTFE